MTFEEGDFLLVDYTLKVKETGQVVDTTIEDVARGAGIYRADRAYEPMLVVLGAGWVLKGLEERLKEMEVGEEKTVELPPEEAYGPRDPSKVVMMPARRISQMGIRPRVGQRVEIEGRVGVIRSVGSGRVQVDFNHPLAGKTLVYDVAVRAKLEEPEEKIRALIRRRLTLVPSDRFGVELGDKEVVIRVPEEAFYVEGIQVIKRGVASDIMRFFGDVEVVRFVEEFKRS
ncbi:peptidylprolyl isomerase [Candidatus Bathyarchaeota archaeon]|nr:MAG: peptidylprolyl isomerase [Candidatus Bathyarchaeota archaeon]